MRKFDLCAEMRIDAGKGLPKRLRKNNKIPAILYDKYSAGVLVCVSEHDVENIINKYGENVIIQLKLNGNETPSVIKEVQRDPLSRKILHIDFQPVSLHEIIHAEVPIVVLNGEKLEKNGWVINRQISEIKVEGEVELLPQAVTIDASKLNLGDVIKVANLEISKEISIINDLNDVILSVTAPKSENNRESENIESVNDDLK